MNDNLAEIHCPLLQPSSVQPNVKTAIFGSNGLLGKQFLSYHRQYFSDCIATMRATCDSAQATKFDILSPTIRHLHLSASGHRHALIFISMSKILECERNVQLSYQINVTKTLELARELSKEDILPIFISSDIVFDGESGNYSESDRTNPLNHYAQQKAEVEAKISEYTNGNYLILRLSKVYSLIKNSGTLLDEMAQKLKNGIVLREADDQIFCPLLINDLIPLVARIQAKNIRGIINVAGCEPWSRYQLASALANAMNLDSALIRRIRIAELGYEASWPKNTTLNISKLINTVGAIEFTPVQDAISHVANNWV